MQTEEGARVNDSVSVILPYFNRVDSLHRAVRSVLDQTYRNLTLLLIDDGSTDGSRESLSVIQDERVTHVAVPKNAGASASRNMGLRLASTRLVAFMDSDDEWLPQKLERQVAHLRRSQAEGHRVSVLGCGWRLSEDVGAYPNFSAGPFSRQDMLRGVTGTGTPMLLVDRAMSARAASFDASLRSLEERDFVLSCLANGSVLAVLPETLVTVTRGRADHVARPHETALAWEYLIRKYAEDMASDDDLKSWYHFRAAREFLLAGERRHGFRHVRQALSCQPARRSVHLTAGLVARSKGFGLAQRLLPL